MKTTRSITAALSLTLALGLAACDGGEDDAPADQTSVAATEDQEVTATATEAAAETASESPSESDEAGESGDSAQGTATAEATASDDDTDDDGQDDDSDGVVGGGPAADLTPSALAAIETAVAEVEGTAYEVDDREDGFWEVDVMTAGGGAEVIVAPDGTTVDSIVDDADDVLDDTGRQSLADAQVSLAEAIVAAVQAAEGQLDSAELAEVEGRWWWRVVVDSADQDDIELRVDPATGEVVASAG